MVAEAHRPAWKTLVAFGIIYFVWGSTFYAIRVGVREVPPFLLAAMRFLIAGVALYGWTRARGERGPSGREWASVSLVAFLIFGGGLRVGVLGGAARGVGAGGGDAGDDSGFHGARGKFYFGDAATYCAAGGSAADWTGRSGGAGKPVAEFGRGADRQDGGGGAGCGGDELVDCVGAGEDDADARFEGGELGSTDAGGGSFPGADFVRARRIPEFSGSECFAGGLDCAGLLDCGGVDYCVHGICVAAAS